MAQCNNCGASVDSPYVGNEGGEYCFECVCDMPKCDDCDVVIEDGDYHRCGPCHARFEARHA